MNKRTLIHINTPMDDCFCVYHRNKAERNLSVPCIHGDPGACDDCYEFYMEQHKGEKSWL